MKVSDIIPLIGQLLDLGLSLATIIQDAENVSNEDKNAMKAAITKARDGVKYWDDDEPGDGT
jgi:hypothetical protein